MCKHKARKDSRSSTHTHTQTERPLHGAYPVTCATGNRADGISWTSLAFVKQHNALTNRAIGANGMLFTPYFILPASWAFCRPIGRVHTFTDTVGSIATIAQVKCQRVPRSSLMCMISAGRCGEFLPSLSLLVPIVWAQITRANDTPSSATGDWCFGRCSDFGTTVWPQRVWSFTPFSWRVLPVCLVL